MASVAVAFESVGKGLRECILLTNNDIRSLKVAIDEGIANSSGQGRVYELEKQYKAAERYLKRLEFQLSKVEELKDQYDLHRKMRDGVRSMGYAFALSPGKERQSALDSIKLGYKECTETLGKIEKEFESSIGTIMIEMKGIQGFARICPGDVFEITLKYGDNQKWKTRGKILKNGNQSWDNEHVVFKCLLDEVICIKAVEVRGLGKNVTLGNKLCETRNLYSAQPQLMTINLNNIGTLKLNLVVTWNALHGLQENSALFKSTTNMLSKSSTSLFGSMRSLPSLFSGASISGRSKSGTLPSQPRCADLFDMTTSPSSIFLGHARPVIMGMKKSQSANNGIVASIKSNADSTSSGSTSSSLHLTGTSSGFGSGSSYAGSNSVPGSALTSPDTESAPILLAPVQSHQHRRYMSTSVTNLARADSGLGCKRMRPTSQIMEYQLPLPSQNPPQVMHTQVQTPIMHRCRGTAGEGTYWSRDMSEDSGTSSMHLVSTSSQAGNRSSFLERSFHHDQDIQEAADENTDCSSDLTDSSPTKSLTDRRPSIEDDHESLSSPPLIHHPMHPVPHQTTSSSSYSIVPVRVQTRPNPVDAHKRNSQVREQSLLLPEDEEEDEFFSPTSSQSESTGSSSKKSPPCPATFLPPPPLPPPPPPVMSENGSRNRDPHPLSGSYPQAVSSTAASASSLSSPQSCVRNLAGTRCSSTSFTSLMNLSDTLINLMSSLEDIQGQYSETQSLQQNVQQLFQVIKQMSHFQRVRNREAQHHHQQQHQQHCSESLGKRSSHTHHPSEGHHSSHGSCLNTSSRYHNSPGIMSDRSRRSSAISNFSLAVESALQSFDFLNTAVAEAPTSGSPPRTPDHERMCRSKSTDHLTATSLSGTGNQLDSSYFPFQKMALRNPRLESTTSFMTTQKEDEPLMDRDHESMSPPSSPMVIPHPYTTGSEQLDLAIMSHLNYCQKLLENLGSFGPLKQREGHSLDKLSNQATVVSKLFRLCHNLKYLMEDMSRLTPKEEDMLQVQAVNIVYQQKQERELSYLREESKTRRIWEAVTMHCTGSGSNAETDFFGSNVVSVTGRQFAQSFQMLIRSLGPNEDGMGTRGRSGTLGRNQDIPAKVAKLLTSRINDSARYEPDCVITVFQLNLHLTGSHSPSSYSSSPSSSASSLESLLKGLTEEITLLDSLGSGDAIQVKQALNKFKRQLPPREPLFQMALLLLDSDPLIARIAETFFLESNKNKSMRQSLISHFVQGLEADSALVRQSSCLVLMLLNAKETTDQLLYISYADTNASVREQGKHTLFSLGDNGRKLYESSQLFANGFQGLTVK